MKKLITIVILLIIIGSCFTFSVLYTFFNLKEPSNIINQRLRKRVLSLPILPKLLRLSQVGDARYEYMYKRDLPLVISLYYQEGATLEEKTISEIPRRMQFATHKYVPIVMNQPIMLKNLPDKSDDETIETLQKTYEHDWQLIPRYVPLHIFVLKYYTPHSSYAGLVVDDHAIFLFTEAMKNVTTDKPTETSIQISTILHEFAHLGGAEHVGSPDCILADRVESLNFYDKITSIRDTYCEDDLKEISKNLEF